MKINLNAAFFAFKRLSQKRWVHIAVFSLFLFSSGETNVYAGPGCNASTVATEFYNLECDYSCIPLGGATATSCSAIKTNGESCGGGNGACPGCHAAGMVSCSIVLIPQTTPTPTPVPTATPMCGQNIFTFTAHCPSGNPWPNSVMHSCLAADSCSSGGLGGGGGSSDSFTQTCVCPAQAQRTNSTSGMWYYMSGAMREQCEPCGAGGSLPLPTPSPSSGCNIDQGGPGRECTTNSDCCSGHCEVAGHQPFMKSRNCAAGDITCITGPLFLSGYASNGSTLFGPGGLAPVGGAPKIAPGKVCVPTALPAYYQDTVAVPTAVPAASINKKLILNDGSYLRCYLEANDLHRNLDGCSCAAGYEAVVVSTADYNTYNISYRPSRLDVLWVQVLEVIKAQPKIAKKVVDHLSDLIPQAGACNSPDPSNIDPRLDCPVNSNYSGSVSACCCNYYQTFGFVSRQACICTQYPNSSTCSGGGPIGTPMEAATPTPTPGSTPTSSGTIARIYSDEGSSPQWRTAPQGYGTGTSSDASANELISKGAGYVLGCIKKCDATTLGRDPLDPLKCLCPSGSAWSSTDQTCKSCPYEGQILDGAGACNCPLGYELVNVAGAQKCRPSMTTEYFRDSNGYPVCGDHRLPMTYGLMANSLSSMGTPKTDRTAVVGGVTYPFAEKRTAPTPDHPRYYYSKLPHCACGQSISAAPTPGALPSDIMAATQSDTADSIQSRDANTGFPNQPYGPVAIAKDNSATIDGRLGSAFKDGNSQCGCPNVNEVLKPMPNGMGYVCVPDVDLNDPNIRFAKFNRDEDDIDGVVKNRTPTGEIRAGDGKIVSKILLPASTTANTATVNYRRGIWRCAQGFLLNSAGKCVFDKTKHMCSSTSVVSSSVGGGFDNVINKKLACCLNAFGSLGSTGSGFTKFDCIENVKDSYSDFNALWASSDAADNGGQMNALVLADASGKPVTGFYNENGMRCGEFSEFSSTPIQPGVVNPVVGVGQMRRAGGSAQSDSFQAQGSSIQNPSGTGFSTMISKLGSKAKVPTTTADRRRCPILVRAALVAGCPSNPQVSNASIKTLEDKSTSPSVRRCAVASSVQVKVRIEQVWEIAGQPKMQTVDTVLDSRNASSISVDRIIQSKYGNKCPPGTSRQGDSCVY